MPHTVLVPSDRLRMETAGPGWAFRAFPRPLSSALSGTSGWARAVSTRRKSSALVKPEDTNGLRSPGRSPRLHQRFVVASRTRNASQGPRGRRPSSRKRESGYVCPSTRRRWREHQFGVPKPVARRGPVSGRDNSAGCPPVGGPVAAEPGGGCSARSDGRHSRPLDAADRPEPLSLACRRRGLDLGDRLTSRGSARRCPRRGSRSAWAQRRLLAKDPPQALRLPELDPST